MTINNLVNHSRVPYRLLLVEVVLTGVSQGLDEDTIIHPLACATLKGYVLTDPTLNSQIEIELMTVRTVDDPQVYFTEARLNEFDMIGFATYTWNDLHIREAGRAARRMCPRIKILLGGPQVSFTAEDVLRRQPDVDFVVCGPGEECLRLLLLAELGLFELKNIAGLGYRTVNGRIVINKGWSICDPNTIPSPFQLGFIDLSNPGKHAVYLETFRGCIHHCGYCLWSGVYSKLAPFPIDQVCLDIDLIYNNSNVVNVYFIDACLFYLPQRAEQILERIRNARYRHPTFFEFDPRHMRREYIRQVKEVCGHDYRLGIQSFDIDVLADADRRIQNLAEITDTFSMIREEDPKALISLALIYGLPGDSLDGFRCTISKGIQLHADSMKFNVLAVLQGTPYWKMADQLGMSYESDPPHRLLCSPDFSSQDIKTCELLSSWVTFILHIPMVKQALFDLADDTNQPQPIIVIEKLIEQMSSDLNLLETLFVRAGQSVETENQNRMVILMAAEDDSIRASVYRAAANVFGGLCEKITSRFTQALSVYEHTGRMPSDQLNVGWRR
jgi:radical SAM superfamily enzyme YgiQ (UPF0313 family)